MARLGRRRRSSAAHEDEPAGSQRVGRRTARNIVIALFALIVTTQQLTPYMLIVGLGVLTFLGVVRPRLLVVLFTFMALAYLLPRLDFIQRYYGLLGSAGGGAPERPHRRRRPPRAGRGRAGSVGACRTPAELHHLGAGLRRGGPPAPRRLQEPGRRRPGGPRPPSSSSPRPMAAGDLCLPVLAALVRAAHRLRARPGGGDLVIE